MKHLLIIGARGFGREVYSTFIKTNQYLSHLIDVKGFLDDKAEALDGLPGNWPPIIGSVEDYELKEDDVFFCALGDPFWRKHYSDLISGKGGHFISIVHPTAQVNHDAKLGDGCFVGAFTTISPNVRVGKHVTILAFVDLGHDTVVGDYTTVESYVFLGGYASVGQLSVLHTKSSILPHKSVGNNCAVGNGSVVIKHVKDGLHVFGNPAVKIDC
jgi:sugar O-acyltransferase (sialic acid O-acetyltransferase NeuD family)